MLKRALTHALFLALIAQSAIAAEAITRHLGDDDRFWWTLLAVQVLWLLGYAASSLALWADWLDGTLKTRLTLVQGAATASLAGNIGFYGAFYYFNMAEVVCFITAAVSAWGGDKFLSPLLSRITGRMGEQAP